MTEMKRRSILERIVGKPLPWLAWTWAALAVIWIVLAIVDPSGFHTFMAITWSVLAIVQLSAATTPASRSTGELRQPKPTPLPTDSTSMPRPGADGRPGRGHAADRPVAAMVSRYASIFRSSAARCRCTSACRARTVA